jgi:hypothetical protein
VQKWYRPEVDPVDRSGLTDWSAPTRVFPTGVNLTLTTLEPMGPPSPTSSSLASENDIEMASLDEINVPPKHYELRDTAQSPPDDHDSDDDDGGERALLGENPQTRWEEKPLSTYLGFWKQTSGIIVEVSVSSFCSSVSNSGPGILDITDSPFHDDGHSVYGEVVF